MARQWSPAWLLLAAACAGGPAAAHGTDDLVRVQLVAPEAGTAAAAPVAMSVQIGENRYARLDVVAGPATIDLGLVEKGWTTFRLSALRWPAPASAPSASCSGGFEAATSRRYQILVRLEGGRLVCAIR